MTKKVTSRFEQKQKQREDLEVVKRALAKAILANGPVVVTGEDWEYLAPMKLAIRQTEESITITVVI